MESCGRLFDEWAAFLEDDEDYFVLRSLADNRFWRNRKWRGFRGIRHAERDDWENGKLLIYHDDLPHFEDAISRAFKRPGQVESVTVRAKPDGTHLIELDVSAKVLRCPHCPKHCAVCAMIAFPQILDPASRRQCSA